MREDCCQPQKMTWRIREKCACSDIITSDVISLTDTWITIWHCDFNSINIQKVKNPLMWFLLLEQYRLMSHSKLWTLCVFVCAGLYMYRSHLCIWIYACVHLYSVRVQLVWIGDEFLFRLVLELRCHVCDCDYLSLYPCVTPSGSLDHQCRRWNACATLVDVKSKFNKPVCIICVADFTAGRSVYTTLLSVAHAISLLWT